MNGRALLVAAVVGALGVSATGCNPGSVSRSAAASAASSLTAGSVEPASGTTEGGTIVTVRGSGFVAGSWVELDRSTWSPAPVFRVLNDLAGSTLESTEGTWNLGIGFFGVVAADAATDVVAALDALGLPAWVAGTVTVGSRDLDGFEQGAKGVDGGAVRLVGTYAS